MVGPSDIEAVVAKIALYPETVGSDDKELLAKLEGNLKMTVFGQDDAVTQMVSAIKLARAGLRGGQKPVGVFYWLGRRAWVKPKSLANWHCRWVGVIAL